MEVAHENEFEATVDGEEEFQDIIVDFNAILRDQYRLPCSICQCINICARHYAEHGHV